MRILYLGDVMAGPGLSLVERELPPLKRDLKLDFVVAQAENTATDGKGISPAEFIRLKNAGVDFCTGGNHSLSDKAIVPMLEDTAQPIIRPANLPGGTPGRGYKYARAGQGNVLVISLLGRVVGKDADLATDNPLKIVDGILERERAVRRVATIVNFHGDYSSEKVIIGHYLDGRVSMVVGDHWHVPTADARVLPKGTAHVTDIGMCGALDSSLGVRYDAMISVWRDGKKVGQSIETEGPMQLCGLLVDVDGQTGLARSAEPIRRVF